MDPPTRESADVATRRHDPDSHGLNLSFPTAPDHNRDTANAIMMGSTDIEKVADEDRPGSKRGLATTEPSRLESLPAELRDLILLNTPDLPTLHALVHASPVMHAQYHINRDKLLRTCVGRELDGFYPDAHACLKSRSGTMGPFRTNEKITDLLDAYRGWLSASGPHADLKSVSQSSLRWLARFHLTVVRPFSRMYSAWALSNLAQAPGSSESLKASRRAAVTIAETTTDEAEEARKSASAEAAQYQDVMLSRSEEIRIFQALYRHETYCHLFGRNKAKRRGGFGRDEINNMLFSLFYPWEAEAVGCIDMFIRHKYAIILHEVREELHAGSPRFRNADGSSTPKGSVDLYGVIEYNGKSAPFRHCEVTIH
jgi:hypothetical protein